MVYLINNKSILLGEFGNRLTILINRIIIYNNHYTGRYIHNKHRGDVK